MKTKNIQSSFAFVVGSIVPDFPETIKRLDGETDDDFSKRQESLRAKMVEASAMADGDDKTKAVDELRELLLPGLLQAVDAVGARLPTDKVDVNLRLGNFFFDLYMMSAKVPAQAPLAVAIHQKRLQDLAERLDQDEVGLTKEELSVIRLGLEDEKAWENVRMSAFVQVGEERRYVVLNKNASAYFAPVLQAAITYILGYDKVG